MGSALIPSRHEVEVSLFGPGYGECVVVHLGEGEWIIVDSCENDVGVPVALAYLESLGVDVATAVRLVVVSHWHDDHVRGIARVVDAAQAARVVFSIALGKKELAELCEVRSVSGATSSGIDEMRRVLTTLEARQSPLWAGPDRRVFQRAGAISSEVWTLSPADDRFTETLAVFRSALAATASLRVAPLQPNETAIALHVSVGERVLLLGSDLEETGIRGWTSIVASTSRPQAHADLYKVAHHGSVTGHHDTIWSDLLQTGPVCVLSPFRRGNVELPSAADGRRLRASGAERLYQTSAGQPPSTVRRTGAKKKAIERFVRRIVPALAPCGHVRLRTDARSSADPWRVDLDANAFRVEAVA